MTGTEPETYRDRIQAAKVCVYQYELYLIPDDLQVLRALSLSRLSDDTSQGLLVPGDKADFIARRDRRQMIGLRHVLHATSAL